MRGFENSEQRSQRLPEVLPLAVVAGRDVAAAKGEAVTAALRNMLQSCPVPPELMARIEAACAQERLRDAG